MDEPQAHSAEAHRHHPKDEAQKRAAQEQLERELIAGLDSGASIEVTPEYWEERRRELAHRRGKKP